MSDLAPRMLSITWKRVVVCHMKTLLRRISNGLFFEGPDKWTDNAAQGLNFRSIDRALGFINTYKLQDVELAFTFDDSETVTCAPLEKIAVPFSED